MLLYAGEIDGITDPFVYGFDPAIKSVRIPRCTRHNDGIAREHDKDSQIFSIKKDGSDYDVLRTFNAEQSASTAGGVP